jgi:hypothetical protein
MGKYSQFTVYSFSYVAGSYVAVTDRNLEIEILD